jgi:hypothetical protein
MEGTAGAEPSEAQRAQPDRSLWQQTPRAAMWWCLLFSTVTTTGLVLLIGFLVALYGFSFLFFDAMGRGDGVRPDLNGFGVAFVLAVVVDMGTALTLAWLAGKSPVRTWPPALQGLAAALLALAAAMCAIAVPLRISPLDLVRLVLQL